MNSFFVRKFVIQGIFIGVALILLSRLFYIQVFDKSYILSANQNAIRTVKIYPARGLILDRNGKILVQNEPVYDIMVIPNDVKPFDTLEFCALIGIDKAGFDKRFTKARKYSPYKASPFEKQVPPKTYAGFQEKLYQYHGFYVQKRTVRSYPDSVAAQFLGYIGEVNEKAIEKSGGYYTQGDYIGITGVEKAYENELQGTRGVQYIMVDALNRPKGPYAGGKSDTIAMAGEKLISSLDIRIQKLGEQLMRNKVGSIIAIEPATGEILAFISSPGYDPNLMVLGKQRGENYTKLDKDPYNPMFIRPIQAGYPPGSSFKPLDALIALQQGILTPSTTFNCPGYYQAGNLRVKCEHADGVTNLTKAIKVSCNTYFWNTFEQIMNQNGPRNIRFAFNKWHDQVLLFGLGNKLDIDLPNERGGFIPDDSYYDKRHGKGRWRSSSIISLGIGQGELLATPLQLANIECIIANRGYYYTPHLIKSIGQKQIIKPEFTVKHSVNIAPEHFVPVIDGMQQVVESGTAYNARIPNIIMCGKTGTVQNPHGKNHSVFVAFAPRDNPKIAIAVVVENAGYGAAWAAPIAGYMVEKYLTDSISKPMGEVRYIMDKNLLPPLKPAKIKLPGNKNDSLKKSSVIMKKAAIPVRKKPYQEGQMLSKYFKKEENE